MAHQLARAMVPDRSMAPGPPPRAELLAGLAFLEDSRDPRWGTGGLREWFQQHLVETGCMAPPVVANEHSAGSVALHASCGFEKVSHFREVGFKFGQWLDVVHMQLWI